MKIKVHFKSVLLCGCVLFPVYVQAQNVKGKITDYNGEPVSYANVVALSLPDSAFVSGTVTAADGTFVFDAGGTGKLLRVSSVGYKTLYADLKEDMGSMRLVPETTMLNEVVIRSNLPKTRIKGDAMVTNVSGTVLETAGSMEHLLDRIPNVMARNGEIKVFGRGKPEIYINGRKMLDDTELERLSSDDIKQVEVIANPGARYSASVTSVIRITTKKAVGEGFGFDNKLFGELNDYGYLVGQDRLNMNWRDGGLDISGTLQMSKWANPDPKRIEQITYLDKTWRQLSSIDQVYKREDFYSRLALSYVFNQNHSVGASIRYSRLPWNHADGGMRSDVTQDEVETESLISSYTSDSQGTTVQGNAYYVGRIGEWNIDFNADWYWSESDDRMNTIEDYKETGQNSVSNDVTTGSESRNNLIASKLVLAAPLFGGNVSFGGEYSFSERKSLYSVFPKGIIDDDNSRIEEGMASAFVEYSRRLGPVNIQAGLRYENVNFDYYEDGKYIGEQSRVFNNLFPSLSLSAMFGGLGLQLGYSSDISRPSYNSLRSSINYDNRYTYEGGNPFLLPSKSNDVNFAASYKWIMLSAGWSHVMDPIISHSEAYDDNPAVALFTQVNGESYDKVYASINLSPTFGIWHPSLMAGVQKQWFGMAVRGHSRLSNPLGTFRLNNTLDTKLCQIGLFLTYQTQGADENIFLNSSSFRMDMSLYKSFFKDRLTVQLYASNMFKTDSRDLTMYYGTMREALYHAPAQREINITVRYKFNVDKSKYKGTGAGSAQKSRM